MEVNWAWYSVCCWESTDDTTVLTATVGISESIYQSQFQRSHLPHTERAPAAAGLLLHRPNSILSKSFLWRLAVPQQQWPHLSVPTALFSISFRATFTCIQGELDFQAVSWNVQWELSETCCSFIIFLPQCCVSQIKILHTLYSRRNNFIVSIWQVSLWMTRTAC